MRRLRVFYLWLFGLAVAVGLWIGFDMPPLRSWWFAIILYTAGVPALLLAWKLRIFPTRRTGYAALVPILSLGLLLPEQTALLFWIFTWIAAGLFTLLFLVDLATLPRHKQFSVQRTMLRTASVGKSHDVTLAVSHFGKRPARFLIKDGAWPVLCPEPGEFTAQLPGQSRATFAYKLRPGKRGAFELKRAFLRVRSWLGFWQRVLHYEAKSVLHVYPDMRQMQEYALAARTNLLSLFGVRRTRRAGQDNNFERLRDYTLDDNYRHLDWRATARRQKLTVKDFQTNQSQRVIFMLDAGRMMTNTSSGRSLLDYALDAMLMMSYVAVTKGDSVGLICFSDDVHRFVPPGSGKRHMNQLLHAVFDIFPTMKESRYDEAFRYLSTHIRKRSLVVLVTNLIDEVNANQVKEYLSQLAGRHLPLGVFLRDRRLFEAVEPADPEGTALYRASVAADILAWRLQLFTVLRAKGVLAMDLFPENLVAPLVNQYLEIKARHLL